MTSVSSTVATALIMNLCYSDETCSWSWTGMTQEKKTLSLVLCLLNKTFCSIKRGVVKLIFINIYLVGHHLVGCFSSVSLSSYGCTSQLLSLSNNLLSIFPIHCLVYKKCKWAITISQNPRWHYLITICWPVGFKNQSVTNENTNMMWWKYCPICSIFYEYLWRKNVTWNYKLKVIFSKQFRAHFMRYNRSEMIHKNMEEWTN